MIDLFARVPLEPVLTEEQRRELDELASEAIVAVSLAKVINEVCPMTPTLRRRFDRVPMSDRAYIVGKDGSFRRMPGTGRA